MSRIQECLVWALAAILMLTAVVRLGMLPDPYAVGAAGAVGAVRAVGAAVPVEDRRQYRFRALTWSQTQRVFESLVAAAERAPDDVTRARYLARVAALQHERGMDEPAQAAAREALRFAPNDPETRRLIASPLDLQALN